MFSTWVTFSCSFGSSLYLKKMISPAFWRRQVALNKFKCVKILVGNSCNKQSSQCATISSYLLLSDVFSVGIFTSFFVWSGSFAAASITAISAASFLLWIGVIEYNFKSRQKKPGNNNRKSHWSMISKYLQQIVTRNVLHIKSMLRVRLCDVWIRNSHNYTGGFLIRFLTQQNRQSS